MSLFFTGQNIRNLTTPEQEKLASEAQMKANEARRNALRRDLPDFFDEPNWMTGALVSGAGVTVLSGANWMGMNLFSNGNDLYEIPLNYDTREEADPEAFILDPRVAKPTPLPNFAGGPLETDPYLGKNNLEGLIEMTDGIPDEDRMYILSAPNWGEFKDRLMLYRMHDPNIDTELSYAGNSTAPIWTSFGSDATVLASLGFVTEPLAWIGTGARIAKAGEAAAVTARTAAGASTLGTAATRTLIAETVAAMPTTLKMTEMVGRYAALGVIDQTVINAARFGFDDFYHRSGSEIVTEYAFAASLAGVLGGVTASRTIANSMIRDYAESMFNTLPIRPVTASTAAQAVVPSAAPSFSSTVGNKVSIIGNDAARTLVVQVEKVGWTPAMLLKSLKKMGYIADDVKSLKNIPNDPKLIASINRLLETERVITGYKGKLIKLKPGNIGKAGANSLAKRLGQIIRSAPEAFAAKAKAVANKKNSAERIAARMLIEDMNEAGYKVDTLADISNHPDVLAKVDAWIEARSEGRNDPFGFRRDPSANATPSQPFNGTAQPSVGVTSAANAASPQASIVNGTTQQINAAPAAAQAAAPPPIPASAVTASPAPAANAVPNPPANSSALGTNVLPLSRNTAVSDLPAPAAGMNADQAVEAAVPKNNIGIPGLNAELNQSASVLRSKNPLARLFGYRAFWARRVLVDPVTGDPLPQPMTAYESSKQLLDAVMLKTIQFKNHYFRKFVVQSGDPFKTKLNNILGLGRSRTMLDFESRVRKVIRTGTPDQSAAVNEFAAKYIDLLKSTAAEAERLGIEGFEAYRMLDNYFPRTYIWETIERLGSTVEGRKALVSLFEKLLETSPGLREVRVLNSITGRHDILKFKDIPDAAQTLVDRLVRLAVDGENAPYMDFETALIQAVEGVAGPFKELQKSKSPRGRTRILMNESAEINLASDLLGNGKTTLSLDDITHGDLTFVMKKYATSVLGIVAERRFLNQIEADLARMGYKSSIPHGPTNQPVKFNTIADFIEFIQDRGSKNPDWGAATPDEIMQIERIANDLTFKPRVDTVPMKAGKYALPSGISYMATAGASVAKANAFLLYAGKFALAQAAEIGRPFVVLGPIRVLTNLPIALEMMKRWALLDIKQRGQIALLDQFAIASDRLRRTIFNTPQAEIMFSRKGKVRRVMGKAADIYSDVSLLGPLTSFTQIVTGLSKLQYLYDLGSGVATKLDNQTIRALGVTPEQFAKAADFIKNNAVVVRRFGKNRIVDINNINHPDFDYVRTVMDRMVKSRVQDVATTADTGAWADNPFGALFTQFRNYNIKAIDNLLLQNYSRIYNAKKGERAAASSKVAQEVAISFALAGLIKQAVTIGDHYNAEEAGDFVKANELAEQIGIKGLMRQGILGPGEVWIPAMAAEAAWSFNPWDDNPLLSQYRYSGTDMLSFPALQMTKDYYGVAKDVIGAGIKELAQDDDIRFSRDITRQTMTKAQRLIWFNNYLPIQHYLNIKREEISDFYDLPYEQLRRN